MDVNQQKAQAAQDCFEFNPMVNTVYVASDLNCFANRNAAINHARGLDEKEIDVFIRNENVAVIDIDKTDDVTNESLTIPDARLAVIKAVGGAKDKAFSKAPSSIPVVDPNAQPEPAADAAPVEITEAPAQSVHTDPTLIEKLTDIVNEAEHLLGLDETK